MSDKREAFNEVGRLMAEQQTKGGVPSGDHPAFAANTIPDTKAIDQYLGKLFRKMDVDDATKKPRKKVERKPKPDTSELERKWMGNYDWNLKTDQVTPSPGSWMPKAPKESVTMRAARHRIKWLKQFPEWREKFEKIFFAPTPQLQKDQQILEVLDQSSVLWGDWRKPRDPKISIFKPKGK